MVQAFVAYWFHTRFGVAPATLGAIFFGANVLAGVSALTRHPPGRAGSACSNTMVLTHIPSNVLLILVPLMPTLPLAIAMLLAALQHLADGRADPPGLHDGAGRARASARPPRG